MIKYFEEIEDTRQQSGQGQSPQQKPDVMYIIATIIFWLINAVFDVSDYIFEKSYYILVCIILYDKPPFYRL